MRRPASIILLPLGLLLAATAITGVFSQAASAQDTGSAENKSAIAANPPGLTFVLRTVGDRKQFHLGEMIEIEEDYSSAVEGRYYFLQDPSRGEGGYPSRLSILPSDSVIDRLRETGRVSAAAILMASCSSAGVGVGVGAGSGGGCGGCDGVAKLEPEPMRFRSVLNDRFQITAPGHYALTARATNVVTGDAAREPIPLVTPPLEIDIVQDENWSHYQLREASDRFQRAQRNYLLHRWDEVKPTVPQEAVRRVETVREIQESAKIIRFLGTEESLAEAVRLNDGSPRLTLYDNAFFYAILESSHRDLAVKLLADRMLQEDFLVSEEFLDVLTAMTVQQEQPAPFARADQDSQKQLSPLTREILREYVLALGRSLPLKRKPAREVGIKTFEHYASAHYCADGPLLPEDLVELLVQQARTGQE